MASVHIRRKLTLEVEWSGHLLLIREQEGTVNTTTVSDPFHYSSAIVGLENEFLYELKL